MLNASAAIAQLYSFDAYGNALGFNANEALTEFLYSGEQFDSKIGQQYLRARYYDPATGRFNRLDPFFGNLNDPQSLHKYTYTHNDPVNGIDPSGLAVYFIVRPIASWNWAMNLEFATGISVHGYIYVTDPHNDNVKIATYSWHPSTWLKMWEIAFLADKQVPGRIWKNDWRDDPVNLNQFSKILITKDPIKQNKLLNHINVWRGINNVGWEEGNFGVKGVDPEWNNMGNFLTHIDAGLGATNYSFLSNNCFWWGKEMLVGSGAMTNDEFYEKGLHWYNLGAGTTDIPWLQIYQVARSEIAAQITSFVIKQTVVYAGIQNARLNQSIGIACTIAALGFC